MQKHHGDIGLQTTALATLTSLATEPVCRRIMGETGVVQIILDRMRSHPDNITILTRGLCALSNLAADRNVRSMVAATGGIKKLWTRCAHTLKLKRSQSTVCAQSAI